MKHAVRTFNLSGKFMWEGKFETAEKAYAEYVDTIENLKRTLPKGYGVTVVRFNGDRVMTQETIIGEK